MNVVVVFVAFTFCCLRCCPIHHVMPRALIKYYYHGLTMISEIQESGRKVTLVWVPAHVEIPGNETADALAKAATTREQIDRGSIEDVKRAVSHNIIQQWQTRWVSDPRSQHHKTIEKLVYNWRQIPMCLKEEGDFNLKTPYWKMCSESTSVSLEASSRLKMPYLAPSGGWKCPAFPHGMSGPVSPEGRNNNPNKSIWDEFHAQQSSKCGPHFQVDLQKSD